MGPVAVVAARPAIWTEQWLAHAPITRALLTGVPRQARSRRCMRTSRGFRAFPC